MLKKTYPYLLIFLAWFVFSYQYFILGKVPFSSTYQVNFFPPWSTYQELGSPVKNNAQPDIITQIYPWRYFAIEEWKQGRIPLWNPYSFAGTPHLANYQSAVLFPLNIIFFLPIKFVDGWSLLVLFQPLLAGIFTYLFTRSLNISKNGSLLSAISFMFCGFITVWMGYATLGYAILFLPLALFSIEKFFDTKRKFFGFLLSVSIMSSLFSGHFQTSLYFLIAVLAYLIFKYIYSDKRQTLIIFAYYIFGILISMPQLLPSIELYQESVRSQLFRKMETIPWEYLTTLFAPDYYGNPVTRNDWFGHYAEWSSYIGIVGLSFAIFSFFAKKKREIIFFLILAVLSLLLAFNTPLVTILVFLKIPVLSTSAASRIIVLASFSLAILAGFGFDSFFKEIKNKKKLLLWSGSLLLFFIISLGFSFIGIPSDKAQIAQKNTLLPFAILCLVLISVLVNLFIKNKKILMLIPSVLLLLSVFDMLRFSLKWQAFDPKDLVFKSVPTTDFYEKDHAAKRFFGDFTAENSVYYRLQVLGGYDPLYPGRYGRFVRYVGSGTFGEGERSVINFPKKGEYVPQAIDLMGVNYISHKVSDGTFPWAFPFQEYPQEKFSIIYDDSHYKIFENKTAFDKAYVVYKTIKETNDKEILNKMFSNDLSKLAIVEDDFTLDQNGKGKAEIKEYNPTNVKIDITSKGKGLLVLTDNFYPGWKAYVNGQKIDIKRVDYTFRGIEIPNGKSSIEFKYLPQSFTFGIYLFLLGLFGIIFIPIYNKITYKK